ncbi:MAG: hypothetical protein DWH91_14440 [Planctomycetota bacterium]|nr:MAG: hypothetical protein DWH91_14440 [Planctomycetota bacterium]
MSRHFSIPTVLRMVPNTLLRKFLTQLPHSCDGIDWDHMGERQAESLVHLLRTWPADAREFVEGVLRNVFELACESGHQALREAAVELHQQSHVLLAMSQGSLYQRAMWAWLEAPEVFEAALAYYQIEHRHGWRKRDDLPRVTPHTDRHALECLGKDISLLLLSEQGRGQHCTVEYFQRENGIDYFCCYPDDFVQTVSLHDDGGQLTTRSVRQTFEIMFAYHQPTGTLETSAALPPHMKGPLEESFAWMILDTGIGPRVPRQVYHLDRLKDRGFQLDTIPTDEVQVELKRVRLDLPGHNRRITLESRIGESTDVLRMVDECLNEDEVPRDRIQITSATLRFLFRRTAQRRGGSVTIDVSAPNVCNLRSQSPERAEVVRRHLRMWRIAHD